MGFGVIGADGINISFFFAIGLLFQQTNIAEL
jgi:hypothetical protein